MKYERIVLSFLGFFVCGFAVACQPQTAATAAALTSIEKRLEMAAKAVKEYDYVTAVMQYQGIIDGACSSFSKMRACFGLGKVYLHDEDHFPQAREQFKQVVGCAGNNSDFKFFKEAAIIKLNLLICYYNQRADRALQELWPIEEVQAFYNEGIACTVGGGRR